VNRGKIQAISLEISSKDGSGWDELLVRLQNLSNSGARSRSPARSLDMAITKKLRVVFYALATLELLVLSALYAWGRVGLH
jgi:hypothetical protein